MTRRPGKTRHFPGCAPGLAWLYLLGQQGGRVKVGMSRNVDERMYNHPGVVWRHYVTLGPRPLIAQCEQASMRAFRLIGRPERKTPTCEVFFGIDKASAIATVRAAVAATRANAELIERHHAARQAERDAWSAFRAQITVAA